MNMGEIEKDSSSEWRGAQALEHAVANGTLDEVRIVYDTWLSKQQSESPSGVVDKSCLKKAAYRAATTEKPIVLAYLLSQGLQIDLSQGLQFDLILVRDAVLSKCTNVLQVLLDNGWDTNEPESFSDPPFLARAFPDEPLARWFLAHGADPNAPAGEWDTTPLSCAVQKAPLSMIKMLFQHGGSISYGQLLNFACYRTDQESVPIIEFLLNQGAPLNNYLWENVPRLANWAAVGATTPLFNAAETGNKETVQFLLKKGADRNKGSITGKLPITIAAACGYTEIVDILTST